MVVIYKVKYNCYKYLLIVNTIIGDYKMENLLLIIFRTIAVLVILFVLARIMGKKQVSQMNLYDYIIGITIGSIAADISLDIEKDFIAGVLSLAIYGISGALVTYYTMKNIKIRRFINGVPCLLISKGKIIDKNLKKEGIDINDLEEEARQNGFFDLSKVEYAVLEISGKISFSSKTGDDKVTKSDMKIKFQDEGIPANIIIDGVLLENNLKNMNRDRVWLDKELKKRGYDDYNEILLMTLTDKNKINIYNKNEEVPAKIFE